MTVDGILQFTQIVSPVIAAVAVIIAVVKSQQKNTIVLEGLVIDMGNVKKALGLSNGSPEPVFIRSSLVQHMKEEADKEHGRLEGRIEELSRKVDRNSELIAELRGEFNNGN